MWMEAMDIQMANPAKDHKSNFINLSVAISLADRMKGHSRIGDKG